LYLHYLSGRKPPSKPKKELQNAFVFPIRKRESAKVKKGKHFTKRRSKSTAAYPQRKREGNHFEGQCQVYKGW